MNTSETIAALEQAEVPALEIMPGIYDIAPEREEIED